MFWLVQVTTFAILILAANTSFQGFPRLAALMARDGYFPRQFQNLGDRLVYSNGIVVLSAIAIALIVAAASERSELVEHAWMVLSYMYLPVSGFWFLAEWLPTPIRKLGLAVMPSLHSYEMIRGGMLGNRIQTFYDVTYVSYYLAVLTLIGLWMMRGVRRHLEIIE